MRLKLSEVEAVRQQRLARKSGHPVVRRRLSPGWCHNLEYIIMAGKSCMMGNVGSAVVFNPSHPTTHVDVRSLPALLLTGANV